MPPDADPLGEPDADPLGEEAAGWWFDEPIAGDRNSWAIPAAHGSYRGIDLERLDPGDEDDLMLLMEARHPELGAALRSDTDMVVNGEPMNPRLHVTMHHIVARQLLGDDPPQTWQTVQRLAAQGYDWHNIMHMIATLVAQDIHRTMTERQPFDVGDYVRRLEALPGDWPPPSARPPSARLT
jgi:hypothetical protein